MMRIVFLTLVLANVVAFIWYGWIEVPGQTHHAATPLPHVPTLKLISELTPAQRQALVKRATPPPAPAPQKPTPTADSKGPLLCMSYGPFPSDQSEKTALARLHKAGTTVTSRTVPGKVRLGYWVYLPPFITRHQAEAAAKLLKSRGVKDLYVVNDAAYRNAISLGLFSDRYGALAHRKKIRELGYRPLLTERFRDVPHYWLDARGEKKQLPPASAFADLGEGDVKIERQTCGLGN